MPNSEERERFDLKMIETPDNIIYLNNLNWKLIADSFGNLSDSIGLEVHSPYAKTSSYATLAIFNLKFVMFFKLF